MQEDSSIYNTITVKNIDNEDFIFKVNRESYLIRAGEVKKFPKFMVRPMLKHLIDRILIKQDAEGKLLRNQNLRDELATRIILNEESFERPSLPSDREIVDKMNEQKPELDRLLDKNKRSLKQDQQLIPAPAVDLTKTRTVVTKGKTSIKGKGVTANTATDPVVPADIQPVSSKTVTVPAGGVSSEVQEIFDQIEAEKNNVTTVKIPSRQSMMKYAQDVLKLDISEPKTKKAWDKMDDEKLFKELGLDKEEDLASLGVE